MYINIESLWHTPETNSLMEKSITIKENVWNAVSICYCISYLLLCNNVNGSKPHHFTAHASVCQEVGQGSAGMVRLCSICYHLWGLGPQMACHSCFFHYYFSLSNLFFSQSSFTARLIWNQYSNDYKNGIYSNLASEDWSICQSTRGNKSLMPEWAV